MAVNLTNLDVTSSYLDCEICRLIDIYVVAGKGIVFERGSDDAGTTNNFNH